MFDFRYHALSLVAVFLALGIGILLGVTIGDSLVSEAEQGVRSSLRRDVVEARDRAQALGAERERQDRFIERAVPLLVDGRLARERVAIVAFGSLPDDVESPVTDAVEAADGEIGSSTVIETPIDERALADAIGGSFERLGSDEDLLAALGLRLGRSIVEGGTTVQRLKRRFEDDFRGDYEPADAVVFYREPPERSTDTEDALAEALIDGLRSRDLPVVGVERSSTDPSQVRFYRDNELSSVDSVDLAAGRASLVFALAGARGTFGFKGTADEALPKPPR